MQNWSPLAHKVYRLLKAHKIEQGRVLVAVSGGADSLGLLLILNDLKSSLGLELQVAHVHHGPGDLEPGRNRAEELVLKVSSNLNLPVHRARSLKELHSEQDLRKFRRQSLLEFAQNQPGPLWIATGHHLQDLIETRLIRLIRGTGDQGLPAIRVLQNPWLRPLLSSQRREIMQELRRRKIDFWEDPSNQNLGPLRNWLRHQWLPALEQKRPGSVQSLARSLENLAITPAIAKNPVWLGPAILSRGLFHTLDQSQKQQVLAQCLYRVVGLNYTSGQIKEIIKRLDNPKKEHTFRMKNSLWNINAEQISFRKATQSKS